MLQSKKEDPYRKLQVVQGEGPTLCIDCVFPRSERRGKWRHPKTLEESSDIEHAMEFSGLWRCVGPPEKIVDFVTGDINMEEMPRCKAQNKGECPWFTEYYDHTTDQNGLVKYKKPWWKFWSKS